MKKILSISFLLAVAAAVYWFLIKPLLNGAKLKVDNRADLLAVSGAVYQNYQGDQGIYFEQAAIYLLIQEGEIGYKDLSADTLAWLKGTEKEIVSEDEWLEGVQANVDSGKYPSLEAAIKGNALYMAYINGLLRLK